MHEEELLASVRSLFATSDPSVLTGSGPDDCAHLEAASRRIAVSTDAFAEGSHFLPETPAGSVARKALGASVSDLAASACRPRWALVSLCLRRGLGTEWAAEFARELAAAAREFGVTIVGGDTIAASGGTFVSVTVIGEPLPGGPVLRTGGRAGDALIVTGDLGGSLLGRHLRPEPRVREIAALMEFCGSLSRPDAFPTALMDISDGLALDLSRLCRESGVGATVDARLVPVSGAAAETAAGSGKSALDHALADGEDFELLIALPPPVWEAFSSFLAAPEHAVRVAGLAAFTRIGELTADRELCLRNADGTARPLAPTGYEHQW